MLTTNNPTNFQPTSARRSVPLSCGQVAVAIFYGSDTLPSLAAAGVDVKLYRINKLARLGGQIIKKKDVLAASDKEAVQIAADSEDCPICDVLRDGQVVGKIS